MAGSFQQYNETDSLKKVIIGRHKGYRNVPEYTQRINEKQQNGLPNAKELESDFNEFAQTLSSCEVVVLTPDYVGKFVYDQLTPRDLGVTIGHKFVLCNMAKASRRYEAAGIFSHILSMNGEEPNILIPPDPDIKLEGGDIIVDGGFIFVGLSGRTNQAGVKFLMDTFEPEFKVVPLICKSFYDEENILHLDCAFNPVGSSHALIYSPGLKNIPKAISSRYQLIEVSKKAQRALAVNVLSINRQRVIARDHPACKKTNNRMREAGIEVIEIPFDGPPATGGSFRCCSLPLVRDEGN